VCTHTSRLDVLRRSKSASTSEIGRAPKPGDAAGRCRPVILLGWRADCVGRSRARISARGRHHHRPCGRRRCRCQRYNRAQR
jgi:hypothetical protein